MPLMIAVLTLFVAFTTTDGDAETDAERLAKIFSPILILTEDTVSNYGDDRDGGIIVLKPEPVEIMGAESAENIWFKVNDSLVQLSDEMDPGTYQYGWDGRDQQGQPVGSGVYLYRLRAGDKALVGKVTLLR